ASRPHGEVEVGEPIPFAWQTTQPFNADHLAFVNSAPTIRNLHFLPPEPKLYDAAEFQARKASIALRVAWLRSTSAVNKPSRPSGTQWLQPASVSRQKLWPQGTIEEITVGPD